VPARALHAFGEKEGVFDETTVARSPQLDSPGLFLAGAAPPTPQPQGTRRGGRAGEDPPIASQHVRRRLSAACTDHATPRRAPPSRRQSNRRLRPRGAADAVRHGGATASTTRDLYEMEVHLIGAAPGTYEWLLFGERQPVHPNRPPADAITARSSIASPPPPAGAQLAHLGERDRRALCPRRTRDIVKPLWPSTRLAGEVRRGHAPRARRHREPSLADSLGLAACTVMRVPRVRPRAR